MAKQLDISQSFLSTKDHHTSARPSRQTSKRSLRSRQNSFFSQELNPKKYYLNVETFSPKASALKAKPSQNSSEGVRMFNLLSGKAKE